MLAADVVLEVAPEPWEPPDPRRGVLVAGGSSGYAQAPPVYALLILLLTRPAPSPSRWG